MPSPMLGKRIKAARLTRGGLTQEELADQIGVGANTVSRWERDLCAPQGPAKRWFRRHWPEVYAANADAEVTANHPSLTGTDGG